MSSCNTDQQEKSNSKTLDSKKPTSIKHCQDLPEEKNGQVKGTRITDELLEYFRQQNEEMKRCRRKYDMAVYNKKFMELFLEPIIPKNLNNLDYYQRLFSSPCGTTLNEHNVK